MIVSVDDRYRGAHGIGRYAHEVVSRLRLPWRPLGLGGSPHSAGDTFRRLPASVRTGVVYSPGYGALLGSRRQILTVHDLIHLRTQFPQRLQFLAYYNGPVRAAVRRAGVVLTVSETSAQDIREWIRDDRVRVVNAGNGCSAAFTVEGPAVESTEPYAHFVGNTRRHKNLDVVLRALRLAPGVRLRAVVPRAEQDAVARRAADLGVDARVEWAHGVDDVALAALYRGAAITVMPSLDEGFGLPALESISCGTPVLHWRGCPSVAEIVGDRGQALCSGMDAEEWADAMTVAVAAGRRVDPPVGYDWDRTAGIVSDVLEESIGPR